MTKVQVLPTAESSVPPEQPGTVAGHDQLRRKKGDERGFTLIELSLVLVGVGALVFLGFNLWPKVESWLDKRAVAQQLNEMRIAIKDLYGGRSTDYTNLTTAKAIELGLIPGTMTTDATTVYHALGGTVEITGAPNRYTFTFTQLSPDACEDFIQQESLMDARVGSTTLDLATLDPIAAAEACIDAETSNVILSFR